MISSVGWRILGFLINQEGSLSEISRKTKTTKANTFHVLKSLRDADIVRKTVRGRTHVYRFNFLHPSSKGILNSLIDEQRDIYNQRLNSTPKLVDGFLSSALKGNYDGCIFFGSSLKGSFRDIDVFILLAKRREIKEIGKKLKMIDRRLSPVFGSLKEVEGGLKSQDMLYKNISNGIPFGMDIVNLRYADYFLRKADIRERFIMAYRELLLCMEFKEMGYRKEHLERGVMEFIYAVLNYFDLFPKNDREAIALFEKELKDIKPKGLKESIRLMNKYSWIL